MKLKVVCWYEILSVMFSFDFNYSCGVRDLFVEVNCVLMFILLFVVRFMVEWWWF